MLVVCLLSAFAIQRGHSKSAIRTSPPNQREESAIAERHDGLPRGCEGISYKE
jgi:hypothetical protein